MSKLEDTAVFAIEKVLSGLEGTVTKIGELTAQHGEAVVELALGVARVQAGGQLLMGFALLIETLLAVLFYAMLCKRFWGKSKDPGDSKFCLAALGVPLGISHVFIFAAALERLFNLWNWVGLFEPKLYLAKMALSVVTN